MQEDSIKGSEWQPLRRLLLRISCTVSVYFRNLAFVPLEWLNHISGNAFTDTSQSRDKRPRFVINVVLI